MAFSRPGNNHFLIPWLFQVFHDRLNPAHPIVVNYGTFLPAFFYWLIYVFIVFRAGVVNYVVFTTPASFLGVGGLSGSIFSFQFKAPSMFFWATWRKRKRFKTYYLFTHSKDIKSTIHSPFNSVFGLHHLMRDVSPLQLLHVYQFVSNCVGLTLGVGQVWCGEDQHASVVATGVTGGVFFLLFRGWYIRASVPFSWTRYLSHAWRKFLEKLAHISNFEINLTIKNCGHILQIHKQIFTIAQTSQTGHNEEVVTFWTEMDVGMCNKHLLKP